MDMSTLREFLILAECLNFSHAAKKANISQSSLSKHIKQLENDLGSRLFLRDSHAVELTIIGRVFAEKMERVLAEYDAAVRLVGDLGDSVRSTLNIGIIIAAPQRIIADACRLFRSLSPETRLNIVTLEPEEIVQRIYDDDLDLGITLSLMDSVPNDMVFNVLEWQRFGALVDFRSPLAALPKISASDLADQKLLIPSQDRFPTTSMATINKLQGLFRRSNIVAGTTDIGCIGPIVSAYQYIALTYECVTRLFKEGYTFIPLTDIDIRAAIGPMWKESREDAGIRLIVECLSKAKLA